MDNMQTQRTAVLSPWSEISDASLSDWTASHRLSRQLFTAIHQASSLEGLLATAAVAVRDYFGVDRVGIFRFEPDWPGHGVFVAESVAPELEPGLQRTIQDSYFGHRLTQLYLDGQISAIADIERTGLTPCHLEMLRRFQIRAQLVIPIRAVTGGTSQRLWGLLGIYHCQGPRPWSQGDLETADQVTQLLALAIQHDQDQRQLAAQQEQLAGVMERERTLAATVDKIRRSLDIQTIFETTTQETWRLLNVERAVIYRFAPDWSGEIVAEAMNPEWRSLLESHPLIADTYLQETAGGRYRDNQPSVINDIYQAGYSPCHVALIEQLQARAYIIVPIFQSLQLWGLLAVYQNSAPRQWHGYEVELLTQISTQLGIALQQGELLETTRSQAADLAFAIKELQQTQTHLIQSEKMASLGQLVAGVAHEINNPVNFIFGNLTYIDNYTQDLLELIQLYQQYYIVPPQAIQERIAELDLEFVAEDLPKILASMKMGTERIRQIVLSLRTFSRLDESQMKAVDIHEGIDSTLLILHHRLKARSGHGKIQLDKDYGDLPRVECYAAQLNQVFMNILSNAMDAVEERAAEDATFKPVLKIVTRCLDEQVQIQIFDNGKGISPTAQSQIFDPFFTTKPIGKGTGLGLSISYQIVVERHHGHLQCLSEPGQGTEFRITIPCHSGRLSTVTPPQR
ncbi:GAF domain-containing protein [Spirulina sp. CCNP1310]|uniref:GAF domain-containing sensor histidine kinase n=1 Tax=Spirulina sp. CCNP1310 TaxID=3110249 RepID=UPI002B214443|nr:GAF domain-containing protein [Spirulina sp. CCNP1310]MEA5419131.1 GAF domain-containing protein [Spirulina sp. CCNP1310]